jgi:HEAT repeat protein
VRFRSSKAIALLAEESPELLYPRFDFFLKQLDSPNSILRWNATRALASLAPADRGNKLEAALDKYLSPIPGPQMIGAAAAIRGAAAIALAKPNLADRLARAILGVRRAVYEREECHNVAIGHAIESLERFFEGIADKKAVVEFVRAQRENPRPATRRKALRFLGKHG